ncbi:MAG: hypothetical protein IJY22_02880 [Clostridia bacterium]|nr:hypothetical protein [Clostridia bacterium]
MKKIFLLFMVVNIIFACIACNADTEQDEKESLCVHTYEEETCITPQTCTKCGDTKGEALGHTWGRWITLVKAGVGRAGSRKHTCSICNETEIEEIPAIDESSSQPSQSESDLDKQWFLNQYKIAKQQYIQELNNMITENQSEIEKMHTEISRLNVSYQKEVKYIKKENTSVGIINNKLKAAEAKYNAAVNECRSRITELQEEIAVFEVEMSAPTVDNILTILSKNCSMTSREVYAYYYQYENSVH